MLTGENSALIGISTRSPATHLLTCSSGDPAIAMPCPPVTRSQVQHQPPIPRLVLRRIDPEKVIAAKSALEHRRQTGNLLRYYDPATVVPSPEAPNEPVNESSSDEEDVVSRAMRERTQCKRKKGKKSKPKSGHSKNRLQHKKQRKEKSSVAEKEAQSQDHRLAEGRQTDARRDPEKETNTRPPPAANRDQSQVSPAEQIIGFTR